MAAPEGMSAEYKTTFTKYTNLLDLIGLGLFDESTEIFRRKNAKLFIFMITFSPFVFIQLSLMSKINGDNFLEVAQVTPLIVMFLVDFLKIWIVLSKRQEIRDVFVEISKLWPSEWNRTAEHTEIVTRLFRHHNKMINFFFTFAITNLTVYETMPIAVTLLSKIFGGQVYFLPFQVPDYWPVNSMQTYFITYIVELICTVPCQSCLYLPTDLLIVIFCSNLSILFTLVQFDLENAVRREDLDDKTKRQLYYSDAESYEKVKSVVQTHQQLLRITSNVSDIFGVLLLIHVGCSSIIICFFGFLAVTYGTIVDKISYCITAFNGVFMILSLAIAGQVLFDTSSDVTEAAYQSLWYETDVKVRKLMLFVITRAQRPAYLSAMGYSDMTLRTFSKMFLTAHRILRWYGRTMFGRLLWALLYRVWRIYDLLVSESVVYLK